jgi:hypothetical protein
MLQFHMANKDVATNRTCLAEMNVINKHEVRMKRTKLLYIPTEANNTTSP